MTRYSAMVVLVITMTVAAQKIDHRSFERQADVPTDAVVPFAGAAAASADADPFAMMASLLDPAPTPFIYPVGPSAVPRPLSLPMPSVTDSLTAAATPAPVMQWTDPAGANGVRPPVAMPALTGGNGGVQRYVDDIAGPGTPFDRDLPVTARQPTPRPSFILGVGNASVPFQPTRYGTISGPFEFGSTPIVIEPVASVPEPASLALACVATLMLARRRSKSL